MGKDIIKGFDSGYYMAPNNINDYRIPITDCVGSKKRFMDVYEKFILLTLIRYSNSTGKAFPSYKRISICAECGTTKAKNAVKNLIDNEFIHKKSRGYSVNNEYSCKKTRSNVYVINKKKLDSIPEFSIKI